MSPASKWLAIAASVPVIGLAGFGGVTLMRGHAPAQEAVETAAPDDMDTTSAPEPAPAAQPTNEELARAIAQRAINAPSLADAYAAASVLMDDTVGNVSPGAMALALWADSHGRGVDFLVPQDEVSPRAVRKDVDAARGKRMCIRGHIVQIAREKGTGLYSGLLMSDAMSAHHFFAVGSTGELAEQSRARFCGTITGMYSFANVAGGQTQSIQMVGMFDLPENRVAAR